MAQKLKRAALMFGQVAQEPPKPTLSDFYRGTGEGQIGAVQGVTKQVDDETKKIPGSFGMTYGDDGKASFVPGENQFNPTVAAPTTSTTQFDKDKKYTSSADAAAAATAAEDAGVALDKDKATAVGKLDEAVTDASKKAGEASTAAQEKLTKGNLGERRAPSELEKQAQDYRNVLTSTPGTSNIGAVKNLMQFYDMTKYGALESGLRQGEIALARQQAGVTEAGMEMAEGARAGAVEGYKQGAEQAYTDVRKLIDEDKKAELEKIDKFYKDEKDKAAAAGASAAQQAGDLQKEEDAKADVEINANFRNISEGPGNNIQNILNQLAGRAGGNWLRERGSQALGPLKVKFDTILDNAKAIQASVTLSRAEKKAQLERLSKDAKALEGQMAGELAAFLGDTNTHPGDALDAAEQIVASGLHKSMDYRSIRKIMDRIARDYKNRPNIEEYGSPGKIYKIYEALSGGNNIDNHKFIQGKR